MQDITFVFGIFKLGVMIFLTMLNFKFIKELYILDIYNFLVFKNIVILSQPVNYRN